MLERWHPRAVGTALITSSLAVAVASPVTHLEHPLAWPDPPLSYLFVVLALAIAPLAVGSWSRRSTGSCRWPDPKPQLTSWMLIPAIAAAGLADRHLLDLVAGAARQRSQHPDDQHEQRA